MGVTVVPYSPWKEQLAASFLFPLLHGAIERQRQRDDNRKMNALLGELSGGGEAIGPTMDGGGGGVPQGGDAWERSFWQNEGGDRLAAFDSAVRQPTSQGGGVARLMQLMNSERFGMVDPKLAQSLAAPYIQEQMAMRQAAEQAAAAQQAAMARQAWGDQWMGTTDPAASLRQLILGSGAGHVDKGVVKDYVDWMKHAAPHQEFKDMDLGDRKVGLSYDPITGQVDPVFSGNVGMTPYQAAQNTLGWAEHGAMSEHWGRTDDLAREEFEHKKANPTVPKRDHRLIQDASGNYVRVDMDTGETAPITGADGQPLKGGAKEEDTKGQVTARDRWAQKINLINSKIKSLEARNKALMQDMSMPSQEDLDEIEANQKEIDRLYAEQKALIDGETGSPAPQADNTLKAANVSVLPDAGTATMDESPQDGTPVPEELDPAKSPELAAMDVAVSGDVNPQGQPVKLPLAMQELLTERPFISEQEVVDTLLAEDATDEENAIQEKALRDHYRRYRASIPQPKLISRAQYEKIVEEYGREKANAIIRNAGAQVI